MLIGLEALLSDAESAVTMPREFIVPGDSRLSAALEVARTVVRRAERRVIAVDHERLVPGAWIMPYLNRLADLLWVLGRLAEQAQDASTTRVRVASGRAGSTPGMTD
jgi:cob(I)alamin adenosyltransferase